MGVAASSERRCRGRFFQWCDYVCRPSQGLFSLPQTSGGSYQLQLGSHWSEH